MTPRQKQIKKQFFRIADEVVASGKVKSERDLSQRVTGDRKTLQTARTRAVLKIQLEWVVQMFEQFEVSFDDMLVTNDTAMIQIAYEDRGKRKMLEEFQSFVSKQLKRVPEPTP